MEELEVTWTYAIKLWWSLLWRSLIFILPASILAGIVIGVIFSIISVNIQEYIYIPQLFGAAIGIYLSVRAMKIILTKTFKGYRIALIKVEAPNELDA